jgi:hypothetical protein
MGLLDDISNEPKSRPGRRCTVDLVMAGMSKDDRSDLQKALDDALIPAMTITRVLQRRDIDLSAPAINRHRRRECACD